LVKKIGNLKQHAAQSTTYFSELEGQNDKQPSNLTLLNIKKGAYYTGIKLFNILPPTIKSLNYDIKVLKPALKDYLFTHAIYSVDDFYLC
jgi:hypothetical protein